MNERDFVIGNADGVNEVHHGEISGFRLPGQCGAIALERRSKGSFAGNLAVVPLEYIDDVIAVLSAFKRQP